MRIDAIFVLAVGAISYLKIMLQLYDNTLVALGIFIVSGGLGIWMGFYTGSSPEDTPTDRSG